MATCLRNQLSSKASMGGRGRSRRALLLLLPLFLFSSFSFGASTLTGFTDCQGSQLPSSGQSACDSLALLDGQSVGFYTFYSPNRCYGPGQNPSNASGYSSLCTAPVTCAVPSGEVVLPNIGSSLTPNSNGVLPSTFCDPSDNCDTESFSSSAGSGGSATNGQSCLPSFPTSSTSSSSSSCPSGYSLADSSGCTCSNSSGSFVSSNGAATNPACNGGSVTAPTLSPVAPVTSGGVTSCPVGSGSVTSGSSVSCFTVVHPPAVSSGSSGSMSGGSGGGSSFHTVAPVTSSNGQLACPAGSSSISGLNGSGLTCIASGSGSGGSGTAPTGSGTSPTGSTSSGQSYPTSISMPALPSVGVLTTALGQIPGAEESTSEQCPAPVTFSVYGHTFAISFSYACTMAAKVRPIVIGVFSLASLLLIVN